MWIAVKHEGEIKIGITGSAFNVAGNTAGG
jgi:hypothetical protein